jgi:MFS transporter, DHA2 family, multidrug resistance protein
VTVLKSEAAEPWRPAVNPWVIAVVVSLAAFMEVLDTSIANVALPHIAGDLGASNDESTWVLTTYLVSNAIVLPISGWLVELFGRKRFFMICIAFFTLSSVVCGMAPSLGLLLVARVLQGAGGGGLQPMAQAILADSFPLERRGLAFSVYGVTAVCAPALGPTLGGWITDNYSWRWIFWINLPVGLIALALVFLLVQDPPYLTTRARGGLRVDYVGFALLALGVGALQIMLDKGQEDDWFESSFITTLALIAAVCLITLVIYEWFRRDPLVDVRLFTNRNFATANLMMFVVGGVSFATTVLVPQFLQTLMGYTAQTAGMVLSVGALLVLVEMPIVGRLIAVFQTRYLVAFGWILLAATMYVSTQQLDLAVSFQSVTWLRILQYLPIPFVFIPTTTAAYIGVPAEKNNSVAGLVNFMRNIGSGVGTSLVTTWIARQSQFHQVHLVSRLAADNPSFQAQVSDLVHRLAAAGLGAWDAQRQAYARLYEMVQGQAQALAYIDTFWLLAVGAGLMFGLAFTLERNDPHASGTVSAH